MGRVLWLDSLGWSDWLYEFFFFFSPSSPFLVSALLLLLPASGPLGHNGTFWTHYAHSNLKLYA